MQLFQRIADNVERMAAIDTNKTQAPQAPDLAEVLRNRKDFSEFVTAVSVYYKGERYTFDPQHDQYLVSAGKGHERVVSTLPPLLQNLFLEAGLFIADTQRISSLSEREARVKSFVEIMRRKYHLDISGGITSTGESQPYNIALFITENSPDVTESDSALVERLQLQPIDAYKFSTDEILDFIEKIASPNFCTNPRRFFYSSLSDGTNDIALVRSNEILSSGHDVHSLHHGDGSDVEASNYMLSSQKAFDAIGYRTSLGLFDETGHDPIGYWVFNDGETSLPNPTREYSTSLYDAEGGFVGDVSSAETHSLWEGAAYTYEPNNLSDIISGINQICSPYIEDINARLEAGEDPSSILQDTEN